MKKLLEMLGFRRSAQKRAESAGATEPLVMVSGRTAAAICEGFKLQEEAKAHLSGRPAPHEFVDRLIRAELYADATRFLAYGLPVREAVWWASLCVRSVPACFGDPVSAAALEVAEAWVKNPTEPAREAAVAAGGKHKFEMPGAPAGWTAMAAGWSSGPPKTDDKNTPSPPEHLTAHAVAGAILLAASVDSGRAMELHKMFLDTGIQIAQGKKKLLP